MMKEATKLARKHVNWKWRMRKEGSSCAHRFEEVVECGGHLEVDEGRERLAAKQHRRQRVRAPEDR